MLRALSIESRYNGGHLIDHPDTAACTKSREFLNAIDQGDPHAAEQLLPLVYKELRKLAAQRLGDEKPGQTLQPTALVHEAYIRLVDVDTAPEWESRGHFFAAAAEAMRRILVDAARRKASQRQGGEWQRHELSEDDLIAAPMNQDQVLELDMALDRLRVLDAQAAELVKLRVFAGMTIDEVAQFQGVSPRTAKRSWAYSRAWLGRHLGSPADRKP